MSINIPRFFLVVGVVSFLLMATIVSLIADDYLSRYISWQSLDKERLEEGFGKYLDRYGIEGEYRACVYAVSCEDGGARLEVIDNWNRWSIEETKAIIWHRRFYDFCPGRTANLGLHIIPANSQSSSLPFGTQTARWSFIHDRFLPRFGSHQSGSFSEEPWERCTLPRAQIGGTDR